MRRFGDDVTARDERIDRARERFTRVRLRSSALEVDLEQLRRTRHEIRFDRVHVTGVGRVVHRLEHARLHSLRRVLRDPEARGDSVRRLEPDAPHVEGQSIRLARHDADRVRAVALEDPDRQRRRRAVRLQKDHHFSHRALLAPRARDALDALLAEPFDLAEKLGLFVEHLQCVHAEGGDDALRVLLADALDHS